MNSLNNFVKNFYEHRTLNEAIARENSDNIYYIHMHVFSEILFRLNNSISTEEKSILAFNKYLEKLDELAKEKPKEIVIIMNNLMLTKNILDEKKFNLLDDLNSKIAKTHIELIDNCIKEGSIPKTNAPLISKLLRTYLLDLAKVYIEPTGKSSKEQLDNMIFGLLGIKK